jgi:hypothetical protein
MKDNFYYKITMTILLPLLMILFFYFTAIHKFEYTSKLGMKLYEEPKLILKQYKSADIELTPEAFSSMSLVAPNLTYVSEAKYYFMIDGLKITVSSKDFNKYTEGDTITYYNELFFDFPSLKK